MMKKRSILFSAAVLTLLTGCSTINKSDESVKATTVSHRKAIAAPYLNGKMTLDGELSESNWKKAGFFDDFEPFRKKKMPDSKTEVRVFHDGEYLYIGMKCYDKREDVRPVNKGNLWAGDCIELFLGGMDPEPGIYQFCWGSGTHRYSANASWEHKSKIFDDYWTSEMRLKLSKIQPNLVNSTLSFHIARLIPKYKTYVVWQNVGNDFQNVPGYPELILGSYDTAAQLKFQYYSDKKLSRAEYEKLSAERTVPAEKIIYGPWLYAASETEMNIGWFNYGRTGSTLYYRQKGETKFEAVRSWNRNNSWDRDQRLHKVQLKGLKKGTVYEYKIENVNGSYSPAVTFPQDGSLYTFTTHGKKDLTIGVFTDVHNEGYGLKPLLENKKLMDNCDILVNVGDMLSNSTGIRSIFHGYLDAQLSFASKKPILNFRGNHEYAGSSPNTFFDVFGTPDFNGYSINRFGDVCIIGLDVWNSKQREWLKKAVRTPDFQTAKHRILFAHYPTLSPKSGYARNILSTLNGIFTGNTPAERLDLLVSGHIHRGYFAPANTNIAVTIDGKKKHSTAKVPFAMFINEGVRYTYDNCMTVVEAKGDSLVVKLIRMDGSVSKEYKIK